MSIVIFHATHRPKINLLLLLFTKINYAREKSLIMRLRLKTASILSKHFSPKAQRRYHHTLCNTLSGCLGNGSLQLFIFSLPPFASLTSAFASLPPHPPVPPLGFFKSFVSLVFLGSIFILYSTLEAVSIKIYLLYYFFNKPAGYNSAVLKMSFSTRKVWGSIPRPVKSDTCSQRLATAATFFWTCVAQALSRGVGPRQSLPHFGTIAFDLRKNFVPAIVTVESVDTRYTVFKETPVLTNCFTAASMIKVQFKQNTLEKLDCRFCCIAS